MQDIEIWTVHCGVPGHAEQLYLRGHGGVRGTERQAFPGSGLGSGSGSALRSLWRVTHLNCPAPPRGPLVDPHPPGRSSAR